MATQTIGNTGIPSSKKVFKEVVKGFLVQTFADDGTRNELDFTSTTTLTAAALEANLVNPDASQRWYPLPEFFDSELPKDENITDTTANGTSFFIQEGKRSFSAIHKAQDPALLRALDAIECSGSADWSIFLVDVCEQIMTEEVEANKGRPLKIAEDTFSSVYNFANATTTNNIAITYDFDRFIKDSRLTVVAVDSDAAILNAVGVVAVTMTISAISTTGYTMTGVFDYGSLGQKGKFVGAVITDFDLDEISPTPGSIVITTVTETPASSGIYVVVHPAATAADVLETTSSDAGIVKKFEIRAVRHTVV